MKLKEKLFTYSLLVVMCVGVAVGTFFGRIGEIISTIVTSLTAVVSAIAVYIQMKKDKDITQTEFLLEFSKFFYTFEGAQKLEKKIDRAMEKNKLYEYSTDDYEEVCDYLLWIEALASMVNRKSLSIKTINDLYSYRFFAVVNNPSIQTKEIANYANYYKNIYHLHREWVKYRKSLGQEILLEEYDLSKTESYNAICKGKF